MDNAHQTQTLRQVSERQAATPAARSDDASHAGPQLLQIPRPGTPLPPALRLLAPAQQHRVIFGLQRSFGNAAVQGLLGKRRSVTGALPKDAGQEEEPVTATATALAAGYVTVDAEQIRPDQVAMAAEEGDRAVDMLADSDLLAKAGISVRASARPSRKLSSKDYGMTYPEHVAVEITAHLDK